MKIRGEIRITAAHAARATRDMLARVHALYLRVRGRYLSRRERRVDANMFFRSFPSREGDQSAHPLKQGRIARRILMRLQVLRHDFSLGFIAAVRYRTANRGAASETEPSPPQEEMLVAGTSADAPGVSRGPAAGTKAVVSHVIPDDGVETNRRHVGRVATAGVEYSGLRMAKRRLAGGPREKTAPDTKIERRALASRKPAGHTGAKGISRETIIVESHENILRLTTRFMNRREIMRPILSAASREVAANGAIPPIRSGEAAATRRHTTWDTDSSMDFAPQRAQAFGDASIRVAADPRGARAPMKFAPAVREQISREKQVAFAAGLMEQEQESSAHDAPWKSRDVTGERPIAKKEIIEQVWSEMLAKPATPAIANFADRIYREIEKKLYIEGDRRAWPMIRP